MKLLRLLAVTILLAGISVPLSLAASHATASQAVAAASNPLAQIPVTGTVTNRHGHALGTFSGTLTVTHFTTQNGKLAAQGTLSGQITRSHGHKVRTITGRAVTVPVTEDPTCTILTLTLGPIDLNLLGLMVHVNQVVVTVTANPAGGILGQLLCSLAGTSTLSQIVSLLNQILALLQGL